MMLSRRYEEITVSELCERLKMPRKAFYRYFDSKDGCLRGLLDHTLFEYWDFESEKTKNTERRSLLSELELFFLFWIKKKELLDALEKSDMLGMLVEISASATSGNVNVGKFLPGEAEWMRERIFQFTICGLMFSMIEWYKAGFNYSTREMAEAAVRMLSKPLFPNLNEVGFL